MDEESQPQVIATGEEKTSHKSLVITISDPTPKCKLEVGPSRQLLEEKSFVSGLHSFMKARGSPIERIPHLGFKQINLWRIYQAVEKLGGYDSVTAQRLWKKVYDELGGSPGSTSAATCTRRHYERLVLPFERHLTGQEDKPLPPSKPRKPYKRSMEGRPSKAEAKMTLSDKEIDSERLPKAAHQGETLLHPFWAATSDRHRLDAMQSSQATADFHRVPVYAISQNPPATSQWAVNAASDAAEVISPLEKKKRMAQASLNTCEDNERPSVIRCSQSPVGASFTRNSSDGSPHPASSSSSRSPSPYSVSSEDWAVEKSGSAPPLNGNTKKPSNGGEDKSPKSPVGKDKKGHRSQTENDVNELQRKHRNTCYPYVVLPVKSDWTPTPSSSFTKVKPGQLARPAPIHPGFLPQKSASPHDFLSNKLKAPWCRPAESRLDSKATLPKLPHPHQKSPQTPTAASGSSLPSSFNKATKDFYHHLSVPPVLLPNGMRVSPSPLMLRHVPVNSAHAALIGPAAYPYPYYVPILSPQTAYAPPTIHPMYQYKL
ncbi:AT-rich interactive domain-containing protein 5A [Neosynchiropus ocellatus]